MTAAVLTRQPVPLQAASMPTLKSNSEQKYNDWRDDFYRDGYVVIKGAISNSKAQSYKQKAMNWLQSFDLGLDFEDPSTWNEKHLPFSVKGGMYGKHCAAHEKYMWDARLEPGVMEPFERIWGTDELVVSFDAINITLPGRKDINWTPWPHVDQSPERKGLSCVQGILNYSRAGPEDGGLLLMKGSAALFDNEIFKHFSPERPKDCPVKHYDFFPFNKDHVAWFESQGCELIKVCAEPGDLILWDSRSLHYAEFPRNDNIRVIQYVSYAPAALASKEDLKLKAEIFQKFEGTTHWPHCNIWSNGKHEIDGKRDSLERDQPLELPIMSRKLLQLAGVEPYDGSKGRN